LTDVACSWWPVLVVNSRSSGPFPSAQALTSGSTLSATGIRRFLPDLVTFAATPSGAARLTRSTGIGTRTKSRTRASRSSDHRSPVHEAIRKSVLGLRGHERFLVYRQYELEPSETPTLPIEAEEPDVLTQHPDGRFRWSAIDPRKPEGDREPPP
jgi:hypothetical protein